MALLTAWNAAFLIPDTLYQVLIGGAIGAINNYWYKTSTLAKRERLEKIIALCEDAELREAIVHAERNDLRSRLILQKNALLLSMIALVLNKRYRR